MGLAKVALVALALLAVYSSVSADRQYYECASSTLHPPRATLPSFAGCGRNGRELMPSIRRRRSDESAAGEDEAYYPPGVNDAVQADVEMPTAVPTHRLHVDHFVDIDDPVSEVCGCACDAHVLFSAAPAVCACVGAARSARGRPGGAAAQFFSPLLPSL